MDESFERGAEMTLNFTCTAKTETIKDAARSLFDRIQADHSDKLDEILQELLIRLLMGDSVVLTVTQSAHKSKIKYKYSWESEMKEARK